MAVTLTQLHAFLALVRRGSVTAAAEELFVTQPSVSAAIAALEREVGVPLTERAGRTLRPTAAGEAYAPYAVDVLGLLERGRRAAGEADAKGARTLRISAVTTAGEFVVPLLIQAFREHHPELEVSLDVGNREDVFRRLTEHEVDVAVTGRVPDDARLRGRAFMDHEFVLITAPGDPLAPRRWVAVEELATRPWLVREAGSGTRILCEEYLAAHGLEPRRLTLGSNGAIKQAARAGLGVALLSRAAVELELALGLLNVIHLRGGLPQRSWYIVRAAVGPVPPAVEAFMAFVESPAARHALARSRAAAAGAPAVDRPARGA
jgi:LysR family transcriptional regulator, low CO2-responsive transcriptional regulator